jgi:hypothetical protein
MRFAGLVILSLLGSRAVAFDVWGFHNGMPLEDAEGHMRQLGYDIVAAVPSTGTGYLSRVYSRKLPSGAPETGYFAAYCDGKLVSIARDYPSGNMSTLYDILSDIKATYGRTSSSIGSNGQNRMIDFETGNGHDDVVRVDLLLNEGDAKDFEIRVFHQKHPFCPAD